MKTIKLTDKEARITSIEIVSQESGLTRVEFEWGGPDDKQMSDFDLPPMAGGESDEWFFLECGTNGNAGRSGWCLFHDGINQGWKVGDTVPLGGEMQRWEVGDG